MNPIKKYKVSIERDIAVAHQLIHHKGKCHNLHGHNLKVIVEITASNLIADGSSKGMVIDFGDVKRLIDKYDHKYLNDEVPEWMRDQPTAERLSEMLALEIVEVSENLYIYNVKVKVYEAEGQYAEFEWREE